MPDISKLPEIAELFDTSVDDILGRRNDMLSRLVSGEEAHLEDYSDSEIREAAMLLKPRQIEEMIAADDPGLQEVNVLLPFLAQEYVESLFDKLHKEGRRVYAFLPFLSEEKVRKLALDAFEKGGVQAASPYLPFLNEADVRTLAGELLQE